MKFRYLLLCSVFAMSFSHVQAQVTYDESVNGELSGDNAAPTDLGSFRAGTNLITGTVVDATGASPNVDVFSFTLGTGSELTGLVLNTFDSTDNLSFIGIDDGRSFPFNASQLNLNPDQSQFIGGTLFGSRFLGSDILPRIGSAAQNGAGFGTGFALPLGAGDYTVYLQQLGSISVDYQFNFIVTGGSLPCDRDGDGGCDIIDLDLLYEASPDETEISDWLNEASDASNPAKANDSDIYIRGDVNLDGDVDSTDLGLLLNAFSSTADVGWGDGDFDADGNVNSTDLGLLLNRFGSASPSVTAVPESDGHTLTLTGLALIALRWRRRRC